MLQFSRVGFETRVPQLTGIKSQGRQNSIPVSVGMQDDTFSKHPVRFGQSNPDTEYDAEQARQAIVNMKDGETKIIGREGDIPLGNHRTSRKHLEIKRLGNLRFIRDLNSAFGTAINGIPIPQDLINKEIAVAPGAELRLGKHFYFTMPDYFPKHGAPSYGLPVASPAVVQQCQRYFENNRLEADERILDGFRDGGRFCPLNDIGFPTQEPTREIMLLDRKQDPLMDICIREASKMTGTQAEKLVALYALSSLMFKRSPFITTRAEDTQLVPNQASLIGEKASLGYGVCRDEALTNKILSDATHDSPAPLKMALARGYVLDLKAIAQGKPVKDAICGHAWNEVEITDGSLPNGKYVYDPTLPPKEMLIPAHSPLASAYLDMKGERIYKS